MPVISTLTITGQLNALGLAFWLVFFLFGRVTSTLLICKGALIQECTGSAFPSHAKLAFTPSQGQALWVFSQSLCSQRLTTEQPRRALGVGGREGPGISPHPAARGTSQSLGELAGPAAPTLQAHPYTQLQAHPFLPSTFPPQCVLSSFHRAGLGSPHFGQD